MDALRALAAVAASPSRMPASRVALVHRRPVYASLLTATPSNCVPLHCLFHWTRRSTRSCSENSSSLTAMRP